MNQNSTTLLARSNAFLKKPNPDILALVLLLALSLAFFIILTNPPKPDPRIYYQVASVELVSYKTDLIQKVPLEANQSAQRKLSLRQMTKMTSIANADCNKLLSSYEDIKAVNFTTILISIYDGSHYIHLDIRLKATLSDRVEPEDKRFHQTFNFVGDSIQIIETKFLY